MGRVTFAVVLFGLLAIARAALDGEEIIGGDDAALGSYTYQISLDVNGKSICGGSIVDEKHVITAAHCVTNKRGNITSHSYKISAGMVNLKGVTRTKVSAVVYKIYVLKEFNPANLKEYKTGDIAVLRLKTALPLGTNPNLSKLDLPKDDTDTFAGKTAVVSGFGLNKVDVVSEEEVNGVSYDKMRYAEANVITTAACQRYYKNKLVSSHLCASLVQRKSSQHEGVCSGDSGGPLVYNNILIGTVSNSPLGCREDRKPAVYTRVSSYVTLLRKAINDEADSAIKSKIVTSRIWG